MNPFKYGCSVDGEFFCPRPALEKTLASYIKAGQNVVMQGERRMGKTSLVLDTVRRMKGVSLFHADFLCVRDQADVCGRLVAALARLEKTDSWLAKILRSVAHLRPVVSIDPSSGSPTVSLDARLASAPSTLESILDALTAQTAKRKICVVLDEFQDILDVEDGERLIAIMRGRIQLDSNTAYVFLGSVRNRMTDIFFHPKSPFYRGAAPLSVESIAADDFYAFLKARFAKDRRVFPRETFDAASVISRNTPGFMQELCDALWQITSCGDTIGKATIPRALDIIYAREHEHFAFFIRQLSPLQTRVLKTIATLGGKEICSAGFLAAANIYNATSVKKAVAKLEREEIVYYFQSEYRFVNPFFAEWVKRAI